MGILSFLVVVYLVKFAAIRAQSANTRCIRYGKFPIEDVTCQSYYFCYWSGGAYQKRIFKCPNSTVFDPAKQLCVLPTSYSCVKSTSTTTTTTKTTVSTTKKSTTASTPKPTTPITPKPTKATTTPKPTKATTTPKSTEGTTTPKSTEGTTTPKSTEGTTTPKSSEATTTTVAPTIKTTTETTAETTIETTIPSTTLAPCTCNSVGRFPIADATCQRYYLCYWENGGYIMRVFKCPNALLFDPDRQLCVLPASSSCKPSGVCVA